MKVKNKTLLIFIILIVIVVSIGAAELIVPEEEGLQTFVSFVIMILLFIILYSINKK